MNRRDAQVFRHLGPVGHHPERSEGSLKEHPVCSIKDSSRFCFLLLSIALFLGIVPVLAQDKDDINQSNAASGGVFGDRALLDGYEAKYIQEPQNVLMSMIADDSLGAYKCAAAIRVFKERYANDVLSKDKPRIFRILLRRFNRTDSPYVKIEIMHTLVILDRYQYFETMVPALILKMDYKNPDVSNMAYEDLLSITQNSYYPREARIVFETLRKVLFLSRNRLENVTVPSENLNHKLDLLRWSIRILGTQELKRLPSEVINLL